MERISEEDEARAMAAARVRRSSAENMSVEELRKSHSPSPLGETGDGSSAGGGEGGLKMVMEEVKEVKEETDTVQEASKVSF